jgi:hypothetical protein
MLVMDQNILTEIPVSWVESVPHLPLLADVVRWELLRKWGLSEVWRVTLRSGEVWIAKRAHGSMARELAIYRELLAPLAVNHPHLHSAWQTATACFLVLEDVGPLTLEMQPGPENFIMAAHELARLRCTSTHHLLEKCCAIPDHYSISADHFLTALDTLLTHPQLAEEQKQILREVAVWLPEQLHVLYTQLPPTLSHNDYHVKNLVLAPASTDTLSVQQAAGIVPVDWAMAFICPYHGDLYSLLRNAGARNVSCSLVLSAYEDELYHLAEYDACARHLLARPLSWQQALGGVCILITSIEWILREAYRELPESVAWIPRMLISMEKCADLVLAS